MSFCIEVIIFFADEYNYRLYWVIDDVWHAFLMSEYHSQDGDYQLAETDDELLIMTGENIVDSWEVYNGWVCEFAPQDWECRKYRTESD
jgi:hypothetical protein